MVDALLVFNPLQEFRFFVLRAPYLDRIGVTPLLRRRLFGLQSLLFSCEFRIPLLASPNTSPRFIFCLCALLLLPFDNFYTSLTIIFALTLRLLHQLSLWLLTLCRFVPTFECSALL